MTIIQLDGRASRRIVAQLGASKEWRGSSKDRTTGKINKYHVTNEDLELIYITDVEYIKEFTLLLTFSNGEKRIVDFLPLFTKKIHEPLREHKNFIQFALTPWTLEWYNGADFAPDFLYRNGKAA